MQIRSKVVFSSVAFVGVASCTLNGTHDGEEQPPDLPSSKQLLPRLLDILKFISS